MVAKKSILKSVPYYRTSTEVVVQIPGCIQSGATILRRLWHVATPVHDVTGLAGSQSMLALLWLPRMLGRPGDSAPPFYLPVQHSNKTFHSTNVFSYRLSVFF